MADDKKLSDSEYMRDLSEALRQLGLKYSDSTVIFCAGALLGQAIRIAELEKKLATSDPHKWDDINL